jgi:beta-glucosidase
MAIFQNIKKQQYRLGAGTLLLAASLLLPAAKLFMLLATVCIAPAQGLSSGKGEPQDWKDRPWLNPNLPIEQRVDALVGRMTLQEKVSQMVNHAPAIPRLGIPAYDWWNECLHGVARAGLATVFPQAIGMGASWDPALLHTEAVAISDEARAKYSMAIQNNIHGIYHGLTFWSPNINIFRDPRWGRGQETYGEDPYLTSKMGIAFIRGLQGGDPHYLKLVATPKHFAVHSGPEPARHSFDARVSEHDLWGTYLVAFEAAIRQGHADSIMGAYSALNGQPCCANPRLLGTILRQQWGFKGYVVSDCGAIGDIFHGHHFAASMPQAAALAVKAGTDLDCGREYLTLTDAVNEGLIQEAAIDQAVKRLFAARFRLGMFDPPSMVPYSKIPYSVVDSVEHRQLALKTARETIVLLKNSGPLLPLKKNLKTIAVIGPNANDQDVLLGNYHGTPSKAVTALEGIRSRVGPDTRVLYAQGCDWLKPADPVKFKDALSEAQQAEVTILVMGINSHLESEESAIDLPGFKQGDRTTLNLPDVQDQLIKTVAALGKPLVLVLMNGSALSVGWANHHIPAIVEAWYPGEAGGAALADVLFGDYDPAGRLPVTFYQSVNQLPPFENYDMAGRTYRFFKDEPLYPFGYGLSYTQFAYSRLKLQPPKVAAGVNLEASAEVRNVGSRAGDEVVELYISQRGAAIPIRWLAGFKRIHLSAGESQTATFTLTPRSLSEIDKLGRRIEKPGEFEISIGGKQPGFTGYLDAATTGVVSGTVEVTGQDPPLRRKSLTSKSKSLHE